MGGGAGGAGGEGGGGGGGGGGAHLLTPPLLEVPLGGAIPIPLPSLKTRFKCEIWENVGCDIWEKWVGGRKTNTSCSRDQFPPKVDEEFPPKVDAEFPPRVEGAPP